MKCFKPIDISHNYNSKLFGAKSCLYDIQYGFLKMVRKAKDSKELWQKIQEMEEQMDFH